SGPGSWFAMVDTSRAVHSKLPVSPDMYRSSYKRDYQWCEEHQPRSEEDMKLKAKEFAVPQEEEVVPYTADGDAGGRKPEGSPSSPKALEQRKHFTSVLPDAESYLPKCYPATELAATQREELERLQALSEPEKQLSFCQHIPAAAETAGTAGMLLCRQKLVPSWASYQQFAMETCRAGQHDAQQNRSTMLGSSALVEGCCDFDWRTTYNTHFQRWPGAHDGYCRANKNISHVFPEDEHLNQ
ncbi:hypothetical protein N325_05671, partial [Colius striatus]